MAHEAHQRIRDLFNQACHGAGATARWEARDALDALAKGGPFDGNANGVPATTAMLEAHGLDLGAWFDSRPISR